MAALLAGEHGDYLAACKQFAEVAEDEAPGPSAFMEVLLAEEDQPAVTQRMQLASSSTDSEVSSSSSLAMRPANLQVTAARRWPGREFFE